MKIKAKGWIRDLRGRPDQDGLKLKSLLELNIRIVAFSMIYDSMIHLVSTTFL